MNYQTEANNTMTIKEGTSGNDERQPSHPDNLLE